MNKKLIASGATADVYKWDDGQVLKLFHPYMGKAAVEYEFKQAQAVINSSINAPQAQELIELDGQFGIIYEYITGEELLTVLLRQLWRVPHYMRDMASLHAEMHNAIASEELPVLHDLLRYKIEETDALTDDLKAQLFRKLGKLPDGNAVLHGDFHPRNILVDDGNYKIIDWLDATRGHPLADVARTYVILSEFPSISNIGFLPALSERSLRLILRHFYLQHYFKVTDYTWQDMKQWLPLVAGARLNEPAGNKNYLLEIVNRYLSNT